MIAVILAALFVVFLVNAYREAKPTGGLFPLWIVAVSAFYLIVRVAL